VGEGVVGLLGCWVMAEKKNSILYLLDAIKTELEGH